MQSVGNKKYVKKEAKNNLRLIALKITNNTGSPVEYQKDFIVLADNNEIEVLPTNVAYNQLKQGVPIYLLYLLLTPTQLTKTETNTSGMTKTENIFPLGLILGPGLAFGNMIAAGTANAKFKKELEDYSIFNKSIAAGETAYAIVAIKEAGFRPLRIKKLR